MSKFQSLERLRHWDGKSFVPFEDAKRVLTELGTPQDSCKSIHVAGTNGKGTVCSLLAAMLASDGFSVGQFVSPHLSDVRERCLINGRPVAGELLEEALTRTLSVCEALNIELSYFILGAISSFLVFEKLGLDWIVIETGLGGRLDATNALSKPELTIITSIGLEHTEFLGATEREIAREKAGIAKSGVELLVGEVSSEALLGIKEVAREQDISLDVIGEHYIVKEGVSGLSIEDSVIVVPQVRQFPGRHNRDNLALAIRAAQKLGIAKEAIRRGIARARWPGRLELVKLPGRGEVLFDCAHNPQGLAFLLSYLDSSFRGRLITILFSSVERKDWRGMLRLLAEFVETRQDSAEAVLTHSGYAGAVNPKELQKNFPGSRVVNECETALTELMSKMSEDSLLVVTGSIFLVGALRPLVVKEPFSTIASTGPT